MPDTAHAAEPPTTHRGDLLAMTAQVVVSYVTRNVVPPSEVPALVATIHAPLNDPSRPPKLDLTTRPLKPMVSVQKFITDTHIISLEGGEPYEALKRHLAKHGLTPAEYRAKWDLPADYPMVAPAYTRARSASAKEMGLVNRRRKR